MHTNGNINKRLAVFGLSAFLIYASIYLVPTSSPAPPSPPPQPPQPVTVMNTTANPALVRSVDSGAVQPVQVRGVVSIPENASHVLQTVYPVPPGKRLVLEYISLQLSFPSGQHPIAPVVFITSTLGPGELSVALQFEGTATGNDFYSGGALVKAYVEAGGEVDVSVDRDSTTDHTGGTLTLSGYLVNVP